MSQYAAVKTGVARRMTMLGILLAVSVVGSFTVGRYGVALHKVAGILLSPIFPLEPFWTSTDFRVVTLIRGPRVAMAVISGAGLAISGAVLQGIFRNPLLEPQVIGVSTGSGFGGALAILFFSSQVLTMGSAFAFGLISVAGVYLMSRSQGRSPVLMLVLSGVIAGAFFTALTSLIKYVADPYDKLPAIVVWLMGSFATMTYKKLFIAAGPIILCCLFLYLIRFRINIVSIGDEEAESLGIKTDRLRWAILTAVTVITAAVVSAAGIIGWVGLVVPHIARMLVGPDHRRLLPASALAGGIYLLWIDNLARAATAAEIPLGVITAIIGAPVFGYLLKRTQGRGWKHD
ncbi:iron ABC transporter permease [Marispirochaeta sp.]|uniref:FecCD family ABC transporter permease n=1 Tax=Marispirochaeta sp. TaxID=2038653 RepID=UPI0029C9A84A|nr:iron ABC transporter permease [Marispirochaeta sp.]